MPKAKGLSDKEVVDMIEAAEKELLNATGKVAKLWKLQMQGALTKQKVLPISKTIHRAIGKQQKLLEKIDDGVLEAVSTETGDKVLIYIQKMNTLMVLDAEMPAARKFLNKGDNANQGRLVKANKRKSRQVKKKPPHANQLLQAMRKGQEMDGQEGALFSAMPVLLILWLGFEAVLKKRA